jgi:hypothetical protein
MTPRSLFLTGAVLGALLVFLGGCNPFASPSQPKGEIVLLFLDPIAGSQNTARIGLQHPDGTVAAGAWELERSSSIGLWASLGAQMDRDAVAFPLGPLPPGGGPPAPVTYEVRGHRDGITTASASITVPF